MVTQLLDTRNYTRWNVTELDNGTIELSPAVKEVMDIKSPYAQGKIHYTRLEDLQADMQRGIYDVI